MPCYSSVIGGYNIRRWVQYIARNANCGADGSVPGCGGAASQVDTFSLLLPDLQSHRQSAPRSLYHRSSFLIAGSFASFAFSRAAAFRVQ